MSQTSYPAFTRNINSSLPNIQLSFAAIHLHDQTRAGSTSGGVFPALARQVLQKGGAVYGAAWTESWHVQHIGIEKEEDLHKLQGAKYAPSHLGKIYADVQARCEKGQSVLFSGTPCQIAGLKQFLQKDYDHLLCVDTICHGVPLEKTWQAYLKNRIAREGKGEQPVAINMRKKTPAWAQYSLAFTYADGTETLSLNRTDLFLRGFVGDYFLRESCYTCPHKGENRASDITLGDFWGIWATHPEMDDHQGTSAVIIHTEKGQRMWDAIAGELRTLAVPLSDITDHNPCYLRPVPKNAKREQVLADLERLPFDQVMESALPKEKVVRFKLLRRIMGKIKRIAKRILFR